MLNGIIDFSLRHRVLVIVLAGITALAGAVSLLHLEIDAFPDTTPVMVQINTVAPSLAPEEVERQITFPVEQAISGLPGLDDLRSVSKFGFSQVVVIFEDGIDIYFARQLINERLSTVELPEGIQRPQMGPVSSGLGEVFHYVLAYEGYDLSKLSEQERGEKLTRLRTMQDWVVKPQLRSVPGVAEVNSWGGYEKQYQIRLDPARLIKYGLTFNDVVRSVHENNRNVGGGSVTDGTRMLLVHGQGRTVDLEQIENIIIDAVDGVPIRVGDVARVEIGHEIRRGAVTADGCGEAVLGLGFMLMGENAHQVTWALKNKLQEIQKELPAGVTIKTVYDRTELVDHVIDTVRNNLFEGGLFVVAVLFMFLGNLRGFAGGVGHSSIDAVCLLGDAEIRYCGKPAEFGSDRFRFGGRQFGGDGRKLRSASGPQQYRPSQSAGDHPCRGGRSAQTNHVRRTDHHDCLFADSHLAGY